MKTSLERLSEEITWTEDVNQKIKAKGYLIGPKIGYGAFSAVFKCTNRDKQFAVKVIDLKRASPAYRDKFFPRELNVIQVIKHRHIIQTVDIFMDNNAKLAFIFMTLAKYDLLTAIERARGRRIPDLQSRKWMRHVTSGLRFLHFHLIAHRDMKVENILIDFKDNALISDFGFVKTFDNNNKNSSKSIKKEASQITVLSETYCGSIQYASPEILANQPYNPFPADIWSFGVLIYATLSGKIIFEGSVREQIMVEQTRVHELINNTNELTNLAKDILHKMMLMSPKDRSTIDQVADHDWIKAVTTSKDSIKSKDSRKSN